MRIQIEIDGHNIIARDGNKVTIFDQTRASVIWGGPERPHYFSVYGLLTERTIDKHVKIALVMEKQASDLDEFFKIVLAGVARWHVSQIWGNEKDLITMNKLARFLQKQWNLENFNWCDSLEFPKLENNVPVIQEWISKGALQIPENVIIGKQISNMEVEDLTDMQKFYAVTALSDIISSFELYPWQKPRPAYNYARREGYGG